MAETERYRLYHCLPDGETAGHLLQIATAVEHNGALDRAGYLLDRLLQDAGRVEEEYVRVKGASKAMLNYQFCFPEIVESFMLPDDTGDRRVNILRFRVVDDVGMMIPLEKFVHQDRLRVDLKTSVWIMGKLLKFLAFVHSVGIAVGSVSLSNILIEPKDHLVVIFDWADAQLMTDGVPKATIEEEIRKAAKCVIDVLGGTPEGGIPDDGSTQYAVYAKHLNELATNGASNALEAHAAFYAVVDGLWKRGYHKFTSKSR